MSIRQTTWSAVSPDRMLRESLILGIVGAMMVLSGGQAAMLDATDIALLELVVGGAIGAVIGFVAHLRRLSEKGLRTFRAESTRPDAVEAEEGRQARSSARMDKAVKRATAETILVATAAYHDNPHRPDREG